MNILELFLTIESKWAYYNAESFCRWFNNFSEDVTYVLKYDHNTKVFLSTAGLRVVELRRNNDEMVLKDWVFSGKILKYSFPIPVDVKEEEDISDSIILAEDNVGNILKLKYWELPWRVFDKSNIQLKLILKQNNIKVDQINDERLQVRSCDILWNY